MTASRGRSRRFTRAKRQYIWTTSLLNTVAVTTVNQIVPLVDILDWGSGITATYQKGATLMSIQGWLASIPLGTTTNASTLFMAIAKLDTDEAVVLDPSVVAQYQDEDIFWTSGNISGTSAADANERRVEHINVRSKRKLTTADVVTLVFNGITAAPEWRVSGVIRALVQLP